MDVTNTVKVATKPFVPIVVSRLLEAKMEVVFDEGPSA